MARGIPELKQRRQTDRRLSFGIYVVIMVILAALVMTISVTMGIFWATRIPRHPGFFPYPQLPFGSQLSSYSWFPFALAGWMIGLIGITIALSIVYWWYQWQLYKRRNEHIERVKRLKLRLRRWLKEEYEVDTNDWTRSDTHLSIREQHRGTGFFVLWVVFSYLFGIVGFVLTLVVWYWLTLDYYVHEQAELEFFRRISQKLEEKGVSFHPEILEPLPPRNMVLYIILMIIPGVNLVWNIWWSYVLFHDGNVHFNTHEHWESQLERIAGQAGPSVSLEPPLEILKERYVRGEISKEDFERMKGELSEE